MEQELIIRSMSVEEGEKGHREREKNRKRGREEIGNEAQSLNRKKV